MSSLLSSGTLLGPYELLLPLPRTGAAQVWVARLIGPGGFRTHLVLKTIPRAYFDAPKRERFLLEQVALAAQIRHPNLVEAIDLGEHEDTLYVAVEWVDGQPLRTVFDEAAPAGGVPLPIAVNVIGQLCRGLHAIHEHRDANGELLGAVHGHVSLQNVLIAYNGVVKLCDFGVASALDRLSFLTAATQRDHKLTFAAPEQLSAQPVDRRSDVFSVGTLLYQLTTSRHPFQGSDVRDTLNKICSDQPAALGRDYPGALDQVLSKALSKTPEDRFGSALEMLEALESAMPECFHTTSDQALATYMDGLCAARRLEVHGQIHVVETKQNKRLSSLPAARLSAHPSLRAVSMDAPSVIVSEPPAPTHSIPPLVASRFSRANLRRAVPLLALPLCFLVCFGLWRWLGSSVRPGPNSALGSSLVTTSGAESPPMPTPKAATPPPAASVATPPATSVATTAPSSQPTTPGPVSVESLALAPRLAPSLPRVAPASALTLPVTSASPPNAAPTAAPAKVDPWDPATFGGRH